ncbi:YceI family protein [Dokdonia ponticola]|uniref:YceI family protein n=1 Tax=Dokdonia ponticola TaxID=2041041 RepID=A0ABV9HYQ2_9FLAO
MNKLLLFFIFIQSVAICQNGTDKQIARQGQVTFFSYTSAENIEAVNNQAYSILDTETNEIAVDILMKAFVFKKKLMREHFNESYIESDLYPKAKFRGKIVGFDPSQEGSQTRMIEGMFTLKDTTVPLAFKVTIERKSTSYKIIGDAEVLLENYDIKIPKLLSPNIAKNIQVSFNFEFKPYEK